MSKPVEQKKVDSERVKVVVRVRPLNDKEEQLGTPIVVKVDTKRHEISLTKSLTNQGIGIGRKASLNPETETKPFTFDGVFDNSLKQGEIYAEVFRSLVDSVLEGFNGTIFAYGQTGTGKTWTMEGSCDREDLYGVMPNSFNHIFNHIAEHSSKRYLVRASYLEIYQEDVRDLLSNGVLKKCEIREGTNGVYIKDLSTYLCSSFQEITDLMAKGNKNRAVGATNMNEHSSRSHAIFQITIETSEQWDDTGEHIRVGKLNLVDLAGSERASKTGAEGERLKEATKINLSLSTLGNVISALVDGAPYIPYRDSKLTRLLQDSLGGNSRTIMVATIGPAGYNYDETLNTLRYASRAKNIKNKPRINENPKDAVLRHYQDEINRLRKLVEERKAQRHPAPEGSSSSSSIGDESEDETNVQDVNAVDLDKKSNHCLKNSHEKSNKQNSIELMEDSKVKQLTELLLPYGIKFEGNISDIQAQLKIRKETLMKDTQIVKEEKERLLSKLQHATDEIKSAESECIHLMTQIEWLESKVLNSSGKKNLMQKMKSQKKEIELKEKELQDQKLRQEELRLALKEKQLTFEETLSTLNSAEKEFDSKVEKVRKLERKMSLLDTEGNELRKEHVENLDQIQTCIEEIKKELKLKKMIVDNFIPRDFQKNFETRIRYDDITDAYFVKPPETKLTEEIPTDKMLLFPMLNLTRFKKLSPTSNTFFTNENLLLLGPELPKWKAKPYAADKMNPRIESLIKDALKDLRNSLVVNCDHKTTVKYSKSLSEQPSYTAVGPNLLLRKISSEKYMDFSLVPSDVSLPRGSNISTVHIPPEALKGRKLSQEELLALPLLTISGQLDFENKNSNYLPQDCMGYANPVISADMVIQEVPLIPEKYGAASSAPDFLTHRRSTNSISRVGTALRPKRQPDDWITKTDIDYELEQMEKELLTQNYFQNKLATEFPNDIPISYEQVQNVGSNSRVSTARPESRKGRLSSVSTSQMNWKTSLESENPQRIERKNSYDQEIIKRIKAVGLHSAREEQELGHQSLGDFLNAGAATQMPHVEYSINRGNSFSASTSKINNFSPDKQKNSEPPFSQSNPQKRPSSSTTKSENKVSGLNKVDSYQKMKVEATKSQEVTCDESLKIPFLGNEYIPITPCHRTKPPTGIPKTTQESIAGKTSPSYEKNVIFAAEENEDSMNDDWNEVTMNTNDFSDSEFNDSSNSSLTEDISLNEVNNNQLGSKESNLSATSTGAKDVNTSRSWKTDYSSERPPTRPSSQRKGN